VPLPRLLCGGGVKRRDLVRQLPYPVLEGHG
jgi:hypothetical protein